MARLGDVFECQLTGEWGNECAENEIGIKVLRTTNFTPEGVINYDDVAVRSISAPKVEKKRLHYGDIILEKSGGTEKTPVGRVVFCDEFIEKDAYLCNNFTQAMRVNKRIAIPRYVFYFMWNLHYSGRTDLLQNKTTGIRNLQIKSYLNEQFPIVSLDEQRKIAEILDKVSDLIAKRRQQLAKLDEMVKARFVEMFGNPITNSTKLPTEAMTEVCTIIDGDRGTNYPKQDEFSDSGYCLFLNAKNVTSNGFLFEKCMYITKEKDNALRKGKLMRGDVVLTTRGTIGNLAFYDESVPFENVRINSGMVILRMKKRIVSEIFFIQQFKMQLQSIKEKVASGSAQPQLPISTMNKIQIMLAPMELQTQFATFVSQVNESKLSIQKSLEKLELLKEILMQKYFK